MRDAIPLGRIAGFVVNVHWSVLVILWLFTWSLATMLPGTVGGYPAVVYWLLGAGGAVTPPNSHNVTLSTDTPALSATFGALAITLAGVRTPAIVISVAWWLATVNLLLGLFNLLPGAPLDGGRLVRAYLWRRHGDSVRAGIGAARAGRVVALVLIALGLAEFVAGGLVGGVWLAFIGWFIFAAAREEETRISTQQLFAGVRVADAMTAQPHTAPGWINVEDFIQRYVLGERHSAYPVADRDGSITGLVALRQLRDVAPSRRSTTSVGDIALPLHSVPTARPQEPLTALLERMAPLGPRSRALVTEGSAVVGIVTPSDVARLIDVYRLAQPEPTFTTSPQDADRFSDAG